VPRLASTSILFYADDGQRRPPKHSFLICVLTHIGFGIFWVVYWDKLLSRVTLKRKIELQIAVANYILFLFIRSAQF
jgi:hypothetical protein